MSPISTLKQGTGPFYFDIVEMVSVGVEGGHIILVLKSLRVIKREASYEDPLSCVRDGL